MALSFYAPERVRIDNLLGRGAERRGDEQDVGGLQQLVQPVRCADPVCRLFAGAAPVDGVDLHAEGAHQPGDRHPDAAEAQYAADAPGQPDIGLELVEAPGAELGMLDEQALGGGQRQGGAVLGHRLGGSAAIAGDRQLRRQVPERHEVHTGRQHLKQPGAGQERPFLPPEVVAGMLRQQRRGALQHVRAGVWRPGVGQMKEGAFPAPGFGDDAAVPLAGVERDDKGVSRQGFRSPARLASTASR